MRRGEGRGGRGGEKEGGEREGTGVEGEGKRRGGWKVRGREGPPIISHTPQFRFSRNMPVAKNI